jgi:hypothetical protein
MQMRHLVKEERKRMRWLIKSYVVDIEIKDHNKDYVVVIEIIRWSVGQVL